MAFLCFSHSNAQDTSTGNLATGTWSGATTGTINDCCSGGSQPIVTPDGTINFGYTQSTVTQTIGINSALQAAGSPVQVNGYDYSWRYVNYDLKSGTITGSIDTVGSTGLVVHSTTWTGNPTPDSTPVLVNGSVTYTTPYPSADLSNINISFTGKDSRFWAGYYGPTVSDVNLSLRYSVDQCALDPLYSPTCPGYAAAFLALQCSINPLYNITCPGYSNVVTGPNIAPSVGTYAISTALSHSGAGITIYGFDYGFNWSRGDGKCYETFLFWCTDYRTWSNVRPALSITNGDGSEILSRSWNFSGDGADSGRVRDTTIFYGTSYNSLTMGNITWSRGTSNVGSVNTFYVRPLMGPDPCADNPLYNISCSGYQDALLAYLASMQSSSSPTASVTTQTTSSGTQIVETTTQGVLAPATSSSSPSTSTTETSIASSSPTTTVANTTTATTTSAVSTAPATSPAPTVSNPQPKVGEVAQSSSPKTTLSTSQILGIIANENSRIASVEKSAVEATTQQAMQAMTSATQQAESVAASAQSQSIAASVEAAQQAQQAAILSSSNAVSVAVNAPSAVQAFTLPGAQNNQRAGTTPQVFSQQSNVSSGSSSTSTFNQSNNVSNIRIETSNYSLIPPVAVVGSSSRRSFIPDTVASINVLPTATPERRILEEIQKPPIQQEVKIEVPGPSVNQRVRDNEAAGGVSMAGMTTQPTGFELYMTAMNDNAQFYAPKDIYKGQKNVDNARLMRGLSGGSDRLHQQMIEQQYGYGR